MRFSQFGLIALLSAVVAVTAQGTASAELIDIRTVWNYNGLNDPFSYAPNSTPPDVNEILGTLGGPGTGSVSNLHNAISPYASTGVGVTWAGWDAFNANYGAVFSANVDWVDAAGTGAQLFRDAPGSTSVTYTGLAASSLYKVEVVMTGPTGVAWDNRINGLNADHSYLNTLGQNAAVGAWNPSTNGSSQNDWLIWDSALSAADGSLTIDFQKSNFSSLDGLHAIRITGLSAVPEPTSLSLAAMGAGTMLLRRWRRRAKDAVSAE